MNREITDDEFHAALKLHLEKQAHEAARRPDPRDGTAEDAADAAQADGPPGRAFYAFGVKAPFRVVKRDPRSGGSGS